MISINIRKSDKCNCEYSLFLSFPYNQNIVDSIKQLPYRYWNTNTREWEIPLNKLQYVLDLFKSSIVDIFDKDGVLFRQQEKPVKTSLNYQFKTTPFQHQMDGLKYGLEHDKWLLGDEQGLGKTKQIIDLACIKKKENGYKHCLIICGVNGLKWNWQNEISIHSNETGYIIGQRLKNNKIIIGSNKDKAYDLDNIDKINDYFLITNVESLRDDAILTKLIKLCKSGEISMIAADEVHKMKNPSSQQGKAFLKLQAPQMVAMTGTPLMNTPLDLYIILKWLGYETHSFYLFKNHYCEMGGYGGYQIVGYKNLKELQVKLDEIMLRRLKNDVLDLPDKLYVDEYVEMDNEQDKIYKEVTCELRNNIDKIKMSNNPLSELIRLRQATGYPGILSSKVTKSAKLDRMEELVNDAIENGKKVVIFSNWTQITDIVKERLSSKYRCLVITGDTKDNERQDAINKFQTDNNYKIMIGSIGALGTGVTLTEGSVEIFLDEPWNKALKDQAEDRCHRIGQKNNITVYTLLTKGTIDEKIHSLVYKKGKMSDLLVDNISDINKDELVDYLLS